MRKIKIPKTFCVQPLQAGQAVQCRASCNTCGLEWDDAIPTTYTPTPSGRCPFEYFHLPEKERVKITTCFVWEDVQAAKPSWSKSKCERFLKEQGDSIRDCMVEAGNEAIQDLVNEY